MAKSWDNGNYPYRIEALVQSVNIDSPLAWFPALVKLTDSEVVPNADMISKRYQIYDHDGNELSYDEEAYSEGASYVNFETHVSGTGWTLYASPTSDQNKVWVYFGYDPGIDQDNPTGVWDSNYNAVFHMDEASGNIIDATSNGNDGTVAGSLNYSQTGKIGDAIDFPGSSDYFNLGSGTDLEPDQAGDFTVEAWINATNVNDFRTIVDNRQSGNGRGFVLRLNQTTGYLFWRIECSNTFNPTITGSANLSGGWHHVVGVRDTGADELRIYVDGASAATAVTDTTTGTFDSSEDVTIGAYALTPSSFEFLGDMDEVRISKGIARSAAWLKFQHANVNEADNELTWGAIEDKPTATGNPWYYYANQGAAS